MNYRIEWIWPVAGIGALTLLTIPVVGAMLGLLVVLLVAVALVGAILALPFLLARTVHRHWRSGRPRPAYIAQARVRKAPRLTPADEHAAVPAAPVPVR